MNDDELAHRARLGDKDCQDHLLNKYKNLVKKLAAPYDLAGGDYQDIIQEGMIGLYKAIRDFDITKGIYFHVFAKTCINRQIFSAIKMANRKKHIPLNNYISIDAQSDDEFELLTGNLGELRNPETLFLKKERSESIRKHLEKVLTKRELEILYLYFENYSYEEIAAKAKISSKGISSTIQRIKRKLLTRGSNIL